MHVETMPGRLLPPALDSALRESRDEADLGHRSASPHAGLTTTTTTCTETCTRPRPRLRLRHRPRHRSQRARVRRRAPRPPVRPRPPTRPLHLLKLLRLAMELRHRPRSSRRCPSGPPCPPEARCFTISASLARRRCRPTRSRQRPPTSSTKGEARPQRTHVYPPRGRYWCTRARPPTPPSPPPTLWPLAGFHICVPSSPTMRPTAPIRASPGL